MTIHIESLTFDTIIGILDFERITPQSVIVDMVLDYVYENNNYINYADLILLIEKQMNEKKYELLETAIEELRENIILKYPQITKLNLKITKPNIINNAKVALSSSWSNS